MELIMSGIGIMLLMLFWNYVWKPAMLDAHRDALFDLRHDLRTKFIENNWDLNSAVYKRLRDLLNGYLRYTENFSYSEFNYIENAVRRNEDLQKALKSRFENQLNEANRDQKIYMQALRSDARGIMMNYMILSSAPLALLTLFLFPFISAYFLISYIARGIGSGSLLFVKRIIKAKELCYIFSNIVILSIAKRVLLEDVVEEYSYRHASV